MRLPKEWRERQQTLPANPGIHGAGMEQSPSFMAVFAIFLAVTLVLAFGGSRPEARHAVEMSPADVQIGVAQHFAN
jgi:hypothetical protein